MTAKSRVCWCFLASLLALLSSACGGSADKKPGEEAGAAIGDGEKDGTAPEALAEAPTDPAQSPEETGAGPVEPEQSGGETTPIEAKLIDDLEDGDDQILPVGGRAGFWHSFNDGTPGGTQVPDPAGEFVLAEGGPEGSALCVHSAGSGFTDWGAGLGFDLNDPTALSEVEAPLGPFDATGLIGIRFQAKGNTYLRVAFPVQAVIPAEEGGTCENSTVEGEECYDVHAMGFSLTKDWKQYEVPFVKLTQEGWGKAAAFDLRTLLGVQFLIPAGVDFDVYLDEISFY